MKIEVNGVKLFVEVFGTKLTANDSTVTERPTVLALHGGPSDHAHMLAMIAPLRDVAQVVLYDHRGCGRSEHGDRTLWTMDQWADDVVGVCDVLGIEKPIVFGHSFGGMVAQAYAVRHPGHAASLILAGTGPRYDLEASVEGFRRQGGDAAGEAWRAFINDPCPDTTATFVEKCRHLYTTSRKMDPNVEGRTITNIDLLFDFFGREFKKFDLVGALGKVTTPVLILGGEEDPVMPPQNQDALEAALTNAPVRRISFPNCGHALAGDAPEALAEALVDWVSR